MQNQIFGLTKPLSIKLSLNWYPVQRTWLKPGYWRFESRWSAMGMFGKTACGARHKTYHKKKEK
jgi:hypothetical protein